MSDDLYQVALDLQRQQLERLGWSHHEHASGCYWQPPRSNQRLSEAAAFAYLASLGYELLEGDPD